MAAKKYATIEQVNEVKAIVTEARDRAAEARDVVWWIWEQVRPKDQAPVPPQPQPEPQPEPPAEEVIHWWEPHDYDWWAQRSAAQMEMIFSWFSAEEKERLVRQYVDRTGGSMAQVWQGMRLEFADGRLQVPRP